MTPETLENDFSGDVEQKVNRLVYYATRHGSAIAALTDGLQDIRVRVQALEEERHKRAIDDARQEERDKALQEELKSLKEAVNSLKGIVNKAVSIIFGAVLLAFVAWVLKGGLA